MKKTLYLLMAFLFTLGFSQIHEIYSFNEAFPYMQDLDEDTLVIFDVDGVIVIPENHCYRLTSFRKYQDQTSIYVDTLNSIEKDYLIGLLAMKSGSLLVDESILQIIETIKDNSAKIVALTAIPSGKIDNIENMTMWRYSQLLKHGIDFSDSFGVDDLQTFTDLPVNLETHPSFYKGVITANGIGVTNKSTTLKSFLEKVDFTPTRVIFFDDHVNHLKDVQNTLPSSIKFTGLHYKGAADIETQATKDGYTKTIKALCAKAKLLANKEGNL